MKYRTLKDTQHNLIRDIKWLAKNGYSKNAQTLFRVISLHSGSDYSDKTLAKLSGLSLATVERVKSDLIFAGLLRTVRLNAKTMFVAIGDIDLPEYTQAKQDKLEIRKAVSEFGVVSKSTSKNNTNKADTKSDTTEKAFDKEMTRAEIKSFIKKIQIPVPSPIEISDDFCF